jgi:hypothetical protein
VTGPTNPSLPPSGLRTVNLDLGNYAELHMVAINASFISSVRLMGSMQSELRKMEINLSNGQVIGMNFDSPEHADQVFGEVIATINRTIPDHVGVITPMRPDQPPPPTNAG